MAKIQDILDSASDDAYEDASEYAVDQQIEAPADRRRTCGFTCSLTEFSAKAHSILTAIPPSCSPIISRYSDEVLIFPVLCDAKVIESISEIVGFDITAERP
jgi:hypothetical protein